jgi:hypothetical protein
VEEQEALILLQDGKITVKYATGHIYFLLDTTSLFQAIQFTAFPKYVMTRDEKREGKSTRERKQGVDQSSRVGYCPEARIASMTASRYCAMPAVRGWKVLIWRVNPYHGISWLV